MEEKEKRIRRRRRGQAWKANWVEGKCLEILHATVVEAMLKLGKLPGHAWKANCGGRQMS